MKIFSIIVTYNGELWLQKCFDHLLNSKVKSEIVFIDNNSTDTTNTIIHQNLDKKVHVIKSKTNLGFGKANNLGIKYALEQKADYIFLLNQDAYIKNDCLSKLIEVSKNNPEYGILSPVHLNGEGNELDKGFIYAISDINCPGFVSDIYLQKQKEIYETRFVNAAAWLIPVECLKKTGVFDPLFIHYGEDDDFINRVRSKGYKVGIVPGTNIRHDRAHASGKYNPMLFHRKVRKVLLQLKNQKKSFGMLFMEFLWQEFLHLTGLLFKLKLGEFRLFLKVDLYCIIRARKIKLSRKISYQEDRAFLD